LLSADKLSAIASALAAVASAVAAIVALSYSQRLETIADTQITIAKTQINATYLSNLYTRQTTVFSDLFVAVTDFRTGFISPEDQIVDSNSNDTPDEVKANLIQRTPLYDSSRNDIIHHVVSARLVSPRNIEPSLEHMIQGVTDLRSLISTYTHNTVVSNDELQRFRNMFRERENLFATQYIELRDCVRSIFMDGHVLDASTVGNCRLSK
jgi:hypothetical protein